MPTKFQAGDKVRLLRDTLHLPKDTECVVVQYSPSGFVVVSTGISACPYLSVYERDLDLIPQPSAFAMAAAGQSYAQLQAAKAKGAIQPRSGYSLYYDFSGKDPHEACTHSWVEYVGFTNRFEYCSKCDVRKAAV